MPADVIASGTGFDSPIWFIYINNTQLQATRRKSMKKFLAILSFISMLLPFSPVSANAAEETVMSLNLTIPPTHNRWVKAIKPWVDELEKRSAGRIKVEPYFAGAMGKQSEVMGSVRNGMADLGEAGYAVSIGNFPFHEQLMSIATPSRYTENTIGLIEEMENAFPEAAAKDWAGTHYLFTHGADGGMFIATRDKPITSLDQLKGMKIGVSGGGLRAERARALGATVVGIPTPDMYMSLEKGVIDGVLTDVDLLVSRRLGEIAKHMTLINLGGACFYMTMNEDTYNRLPDDLKKVVDELSGDYAKELFRNFWLNSLENSGNKWITEMGGQFYVLPEEDYAKADKLLQEVDKKSWISFLSEKGLPAQEMYDKFQELEKNYSTNIAGSPLTKIGAQEKK